MPFSWVRVRGKRAYISGHVATNLDGSLAKPLGKVGTDVTPEQGYASARLVALAHLGSLERALGEETQPDPDGESFLENYELPDVEGSEWGAIPTVDEGWDE